MFSFGCKRVVCIIRETKGEQIGVDGADQYFLHTLLSTEHECECYVIVYNADWHHE